MKGDGACLFRAIWRCLGFADDKDAQGPETSYEGGEFTPYRLRLWLMSVIVLTARKVTSTSEHERPLNVQYRPNVIFILSFFLCRTQSLLLTSPLR